MNTNANTAGKQDEVAETLAQLIVAVLRKLKARPRLVMCPDDEL